MLTAVAAATVATTVATGATVKQFETKFFAHPLKVRKSQVLRIEKRKYKNFRAVANLALKKDRKVNKETFLEKTDSQFAQCEMFPRLRAESTKRLT